MIKNTNLIPDHTAVRVALWRALHIELDSPPHVFNDEIGIKLANPEANWRERPDMHPIGTRGYRASIVARARYIEDLLIEEMKKGVSQYVILGSGLDTFAQRRPDLGNKINVFEIDKPQMQDWKRKRLIETGFGISHNLHLVSVDFESGDSWWNKLLESGFKVNKPTFVASTGVAMYLSPEANKMNFIQLTSLAPGSTVAMTFMLPTHLVAPAEQAQYEMVQERARASGTPFLGLFSPSEILRLANEAGLINAQHIPRTEIIKHYFSNRSDGLVPASGEELLIARTL